MRFTQDAAWRLAGLTAAALLFGVVPLHAQHAADSTITGIVVDTTTSMPLSGVLVRGGSAEATTDARGRFYLSPAHPDSLLTFERLGYRVKVIRAVEIGTAVKLAPEPVMLDALTARHSGEETLVIGTALTAQTVSADAIRARAHTGLAEALSGVEGVAIARMGAWGARPSLRGLDGERLAILVDGSRVNRACAFGMDQGLASIDPNTVERVEILSGPGSALYGSGNVGGVINVVTRRADGDAPLSGEFRTLASSAVPGGALGLTARMQHKRASAALSLDGASYGDYQTPRATVQNSSFRHATANLRFGYDLGRAGRLSLQAETYEGRDIGWPSMMDASIPSQSRRHFALDYGAQLGRGLLDAVATRAYVQRLDHDMVVRMSAPGMNGVPVMSVTGQRSHSTTSGARAQIRLRTNQSTHADVGADFTQWSGENSRWTTRSGASSPLSFRTWPGTEIRDLGAFAQSEMKVFSSLTVTAGARADYTSRDADGHAGTQEWIATGNAGFRLALPASLQARASIGWGYRLPDPTELFGLALRPDGFIYNGNPTLTTERSRSVEAGISHDGDGVYASVTAFRNDLKDLISPVSLPGDSIAGRPVRSYENLSEARVFGLSASVRVKPASRIEVSGTASYTEGEDDRTGTSLPRISPLHGLLGVRLMPGATPQTVIELEGEGAAKQTRNAAGSGEPSTPAYAVVNARIQFALGSSRVNLGVDNVFDRAYRAHLDPVTLLRPGRNFFVRLSRSFGNP